MNERDVYSYGGIAVTKFFYKKVGDTSTGGE